ncbi:MAG: hypothetical protein WAM14_01720 [Candidatus Nitrosopolaris sp.]
MPWGRNKCQAIIKYDGINITFSGLEVQKPIEFKVGDFQIKKDVLQAAIDIEQMYDLFAYRNCERIEQFPEDSPERAKFILETHKSDERLLEFLAMLRIARPSEKIEESLADWVAFTFTKRIREEAPIIPEKVRGGELVRESLPVEEFDNLRRNVTKAKISSPYLKVALQNPTFDINKVYALSAED